MLNNNADKTDEFLGLLVQNQSHIQSYIACLVPHKNDCDDVLQETLSEMWHKFDEFEEGTNFKAWGVAIARLKIFSHRRRHKTTRLYFNSDTIELLEKEAERSSEKGYLQDQKDILRQCLRKLSGKEKKYLSFRYTEQLTFQEVADHFGISMQGAFKAISLIHARLLKCIQSGMKNEGLL
jgi:RNA polymerase sigma-70 factor (ECF subfamily)